MIAGRYTLVREIGRGGMGSVWLGRDELLGREVALKKIGMPPGGSTPDLLRAEREAKLAARLNHPHVVAVYDLVDEDDEQWLVMEHVDGVDLAALVRRDGPLPVDDAAAVVRQAAEALRQAHAAGIVHRDVKPSNIMVTPSGQVKLTDFGIARAEADASLTQTGLVTGSPAYLAPEVASGRPATEASDVWSLGATLFHVLEGRPPYDVGENLLGAMYRIVHEEPPRPSHAGWLAPLLDATMAKDPANRWSMLQVEQFVSRGPRALQPPPVQATSTQVLAAPASERPPPHARVAVPPGHPTESGQHRPRPSALLPVLVVGAVVMAVIVGALALANRGDETPIADDPASTGSATKSTATSSPTETPTPRATPSKSKAAQASAMSSFVEDYLGAAVTDPKVSWQRLTPEFQAESGGYGQYNQFWRDFEDATVIDIGADPQELTVSYTVEYTKEDGGGFTDTVQLRLQRAAGSFLIAGEA